MAPSESPHVSGKKMTQTGEMISIKSNARILILYWLTHLDIVVLKSCVFYIFQQILPLRSLYFISIIKVSAYYKFSKCIRIVVKDWFFSPPHTTHLSSGGGNNKMLSFGFCTPPCSSHGYSEESVTILDQWLWTGLSDALPEIFFALKLRGEMNTLGAELEGCELMNSRQCWFLGEKVRSGE